MSRGPGSMTSTGAPALSAWVARIALIGWHAPASTRERAEADAEVRALSRGGLPAVAELWRAHEAELRAFARREQTPPVWSGQFFGERLAAYEAEKQRPSTREARP